MPDAEVDSEGRGPGTRVDVAPPESEPATLKHSALRELRESWSEPADEDAIDEMVDTRPRRAVMAAPITTPLVPDGMDQEQIEQEDNPTEPVLQAIGLGTMQVIENDQATDAPFVEVAVPSAAAEPDVHMAAPTLEAGVGTLSTPAVVVRASDALTHDEPSDDVAADDSAIVTAPEMVADEAALAGEVTLVPDEWHVRADEVALPTETPYVSDAIAAQAVPSTRVSDEDAVAVGDAADGWLEVSATVEGEVAEEARVTVTELPASSDVPPESAPLGGATAGMLYGYAAVPTRPRTVLPPSGPLPPPFSVPPSVPLLPALTVPPAAPPLNLQPPMPLAPPLSAPPLSAPSSTSSWSVGVPADVGSAQRAAPLLPPLPPTAAVAAPQAPHMPSMSPTRLPSIAGIDTRVPQEYWIEDDPMEQTRLSLGLSGERPVVREAGRPLPKPRRFKRPPRTMSLLVLFLVLAIILITMIGVTVTVAHLLTQPASTPIVVPTHTALPTSPLS